MNLVWVIDEYSDVSEVREVRNQKNIIMDALRNPHKPRPEGEWIGGEIMRQWVLLLSDNETPDLSHRQVLGTYHKERECANTEALHRGIRQVSRVHGTGGH